MAKVSNPRKGFNFSIQFIKHPINPYLFQKVNLPDKEVEQVSHGDTNHDIKTAGRISFGNLTAEKLCTTSGSDVWINSWINSCADATLGGGLTPNEYKETVLISELAEDGVSVLNQHICTGVWPTKVNGKALDRTVSDNTIETIEFSVDNCESI